MLNTSLYDSDYDYFPLPLRMIYNLSWIVEDLQEKLTESFVPKIDIYVIVCV